MDKRGGLRPSPRQTMFEQPLIVTGCPRSGTTALQYVLNKHRHNFVLNEFAVYWPGLHSKATQQLKDQIFGYSDFAPHYVDRPYKLADDDTASLIYKCGGREAIVKLYGFLKGRSPKEIADGLFRAAVTNSRQELSVYGDKQPMASMHLGFKVLRFIESQYPKAKVIVCIRDGRDVIASQVRNYKAGGRHHWMTDDIGQAQKMWLDQMKQWEAVSPSLSLKRWEIRYEQFCASPPSTMAMLEEALGFKYSPEEKAQAIEFFRPTHQGAWREELPDLENYLSEDFKQCLSRWSYK